MIPVIFQLGPIPLNSFGLMMVCCFFAGWRRLCLSLEGAGEDPDIAEPMIVLAAGAGILGSRINYILTNVHDFAAHPAEYIFSGSGFVFYGGFLLALTSLYIFLKRRGKSFFRYADLTAPALAIGYAVGRIGCHLSGDGDYGKATDLPIGFSYALGISPTPPGVLAYPTPIFETFASLFICWLLVRFQQKHLLAATGQLFGLYLVLSAIERFLVEFARIEPLTRFGYTEAQVVAVFMVIAGMIFLLRPGQALRT